jgi:outer membrane lipoprotein-sorting protein
MKLHKKIVFPVAAILSVLIAGAAIVSASPQQAPAAPAPAAQAGIEGTTLSTAEIIRRFSENESQFKRERGNYTYSQSVLVEASLTDGSQAGQFELNSDIVFTPDGKRYEKVTYAPQNTLKVIQLTPQDMKDLESIQPFVLTSEDLFKYDIKYDGKEKIDSLDTFRFTVGPKKLEKDQRYFQGTIWVDDHDFAVVKSDGKAVPDILDKGRENRFPRFVTYRENIEGSYWFPTYTRADDTLSFGGSRDQGSSQVRIRMTVRYKNYKRFGATVRVGPSTQIKEPPAEPETSPR